MRFIITLPLHCGEPQPLSQLNKGSLSFPVGLTADSAGSAPPHWLRSGCEETKIEHLGLLSWERELSGILALCKGANGDQNPQTVAWWAEGVL